MAYITGDIVLDTHYNQFADTDMNGLWGVSTGSSGYGQTGALTTVADGQTVTATQWTNLFGRMQTIANHQGSSITTPASVSTGSTIEIVAALENDISTLQTNRFNAASFGASTDRAVTYDADAAAWTGTVTCQQTLTFAGGDEARYFFNAGGKIQISHSLSGGTSTGKYNEWVDLCGTLCGTYEIGGDTGGDVGGSKPFNASNVNLTTTGYYDLPDAEGTVVFRQYADDSHYTSNYIQITAWTDADHSDGRGNNGEVVNVKVEYVDAAAEDSNPGFGPSGDDPSLDQIDGQLTTTFKAVPPATTYISDTWGSLTWSNNASTHA